MNYSNYRASLDIHAAGSQAVLHAKQGDTKRQILVTLTEDGRPYLISSDCRAVFTAKKPDGSILFNDCAIEGNLISYSFTAQTTALAGRLDCEIRLYGADNGLITSPGFDLIVDATVYEDGDVVESAAEVSALTSLVSEANTLVSEVNRKLENGEFNGPKGDKGDTGATGPAGADGAPGTDGKSAYQYAQEGGYTGTEAEFAAKLAQEKYANPEALTFTGAATGSYDGSQPLTVNIPSGGGGDNPWRLIKTVTLKETVKSITVDTDSDGNAFSLSEIYINTNVTNSEDQTVATSFSLKINGKNTNSIGTTAGLYVQCGKTGETGRNWLWLMSLNPLRALHGIWMASNTASGKTVQCYQPNEFGDTNPNPHSVGEKITSITIEGMASTAYMSAGSEFRIYGR